MMRRQTLTACRAAISEDALGKGVTGDEVTEDTEHGEQTERDGETEHLTPVSSPRHAVIVCWVRRADDTCLPLLR